MATDRNARAALVTGASGFIGGALAAEAARRGWKIVALCRPSSDLSRLGAPGFARADCDDWSADGLRRAVGSHAFDAIFHLAAYGVRPSDREVDACFSVNTALPATLVGLAAERGAVMVSVGSCAEYAETENGERLTETSPLETRKLYGATKAAGGVAALAAGAALSTPLAVLRLFNIYGPGEAKHRLLPSLCRSLRRRARAPLSPGAQVRDFVFLGDAVEAMMACAERLLDRRDPQANGVWNVCTGTGRTVRDFAETAADQLGAERDLLGFGDLPMRPDEVAHIVGDPDAFAREFGWTAQYALADGIGAALTALAADNQGQR